jgi:hypothetical protein
VSAGVSVAGGYHLMQQQRRRLIGRNFEMQIPTLFLCQVRRDIRRLHGQNWLQHPEAC